jgi:hypothetical protein
MGMRTNVNDVGNQTHMGADVMGMRTNVNDVGNQ